MNHGGGPGRESVKVKRTIFLILTRRAIETSLPDHASRSTGGPLGLQPGGFWWGLLRRVVPLPHTGLFLLDVPVAGGVSGRVHPASTLSTARRSCYPAPSPAALALRAYTSGGPTTAVIHTRYVSSRRRDGQLRSSSSLSLTLPPTPGCGPFWTHPSMMVPRDASFATLTFHLFLKNVFCFFSAALGL